MAGDASFDVVSDFDRQELVNALDQARREIATRFDFKGAKADIDLGKEEILIHTDSETRAKAIRELIESKAVKRGLSLKIFDWGAIDAAGGMTVRQKVGLKKGLSDELWEIGMFYGDGGRIFGPLGWTPCNIFGRMVDGLDAFAAACQRIRVEGVKTVEIGRL